MQLKKIIAIFLFAGPVCLETSGQEARPVLTGQVSYLTSRNIYATFKSTEGVQPGDTIYLKLKVGGTPLFTVESLSSTSCMGKPIGSSQVKMGDEVYAIPKPSLKKGPDSPKMPVLKSQENPVAAESTDTAAKEKSLARKQTIRGYLNLASYLNFSNTAAKPMQRMRYSLSFDANNLGNSRFFLESYFLFTHQFNDLDSIRNNLFYALKIYSLAIRYDLGSSSKVWFGRKINPNLSNIGAVDGLQAETRLGAFTLGAVAGSRPGDLYYNVNTRLPEFGAFIGHSLKSLPGKLQTSLAVFEQRNNGATDRRFAYFQHSNALLKNLYFFTSCEMDLYKVVEGTPLTQPSLTSLYASLRYRILRNFTVFASYDARRNVIYYETYKGFADRLLEEATRQGLQLRLNLNTKKYLSMGVNGSYRYGKGDISPAETLNAFVSAYQIPVIKISATLTANYLKTSYVNGGIVGLRLARDLIPGKIYSEINYRYVDYKFPSGGTSLFQHIVQADLSWQLKHKMSFSVDYELTMEGSNKYHRIYISFGQRF